MSLQAEVRDRACSAHVDSDADLVERFWSGDESALDALLDRYRSLVRAKSRSYFLAGADREDVVQEGMIGLYKAIRDFDPAREASFRGFAELCITRQIITAVKSATRQKHTPLNSYVSLYLPACQEDEPDHRLVDFVADDDPDPAARVVSVDDASQLRAHCTQTLSDLEADVLRRYLEGESYQEIALRLGRQVKSIDNALQRIKRKLDAYIESRRADSRA